MMVNGIYVVQNECSACVALLRKAHKGWAQHQPSMMDDHDPLLRNFTDLRDVLNSVSDLSEMNPDTFLSPFLEVVKSEHTNGPVTAQAMSSVGKFIDFGLVDMHAMKTANAVETIAEAVTRTKFVGGADSGSDECVLLRILLTLRTLMLSPAGRQLSNESVCEMMQTCFRIAFSSENSVSDVLRKMAESTLGDMTRLLFTRLPTFTEDINHPYIRNLVMKATNAKRRKRRSKTVEERKEEADPELLQSPDAIRCAEVCRPDEQVCSAAPKPVEQQEKEPLIENAKEKPEEIAEEVQGSLQEGEVISLTPEEPIEKVIECTAEDEIDEGDQPDNESSSTSDGEVPLTPKQRVNGRGVKFSTEYDAAALNRNSSASGSQRATTHIPYGLPCVRELLRFLTSLINPLERANTEEMTLMGLNLLTVAMEAGADFLHGYALLLPLVKNELCRALIQLLESEKLPVFAAASRVCFLLFEALRTALKFQMEAYFLKLKSIITSDQMKVSYEHKEMALESLVHLWRIPGLVTELYLNYDCDLYCTNLFEDLTKLLMEHAFPVVGLRSTNILSLDALLTVVDTIDMNCLSRGEQFVAPPNDNTDTGKVAFQMAAQQAQNQVRPNRMPVSEAIPSMKDVIERKKKKRIVSEATEKFNQSPKHGIEFLKERGILMNPLDALDVASWLRGNPRLDKNRIADYICSRKHADVLEHFVKSFPFESTRLDVALRMFLETFRLPGEAADISMVMQHFADHWYDANSKPFNHVDAAFTLAYAIIMLNTDQHNKQVRRNQQPMTIDCFKRNLSGTNGGADFDPEMLEQIYHAIKTDEIVMPAEQTGLVKENYLWKVLLRRGDTGEGEFLHAPVGWNDHDLFGIIWGSVTAALSYVFEKSEQDQILMKALNGFRKCAAIAAHYGMSDVFDNLVICLCKFSTLMGSGDNARDHMVNELHRSASMNDTSFLSMADGVAIAYGENNKAQMATKALFEQVHMHGDILRDGWKNILECLLHLFHAKLLPSALTEVEDFVDSKKWVSILRDHSKKVVHNKHDSGLLSWFGLGGSSSDARENKKPTPEQEELIKHARAVIFECKPDQLIKDGKYLTSSALSELMNSVYAASSVVRGSSGGKQAKKLTEQDEDSIIFYLELMISIAIENKDRLAVIWPVVHRHLQWLMKDFGQNPLVVERAVVGLLRLSNRVLYHLKDKEEDDIADDVLQSLTMLLSLHPPAMFMFSRQIAYGLHDLLQANAANVHRSSHWALIFALMEATGAAAYPDEIMDSPNTQSRLVQSESEQVDQPFLVEDRGYTSDDPMILQKQQHLHQQVSASLSSVKSTSNEWIQVDHESSQLVPATVAEEAGSNATKTFERGTIVLVPNLSRHEPAAFLRVGDTMAFLARDAAHITPENFESCVRCLRALIEASLDGGKYAAGPFSGDAHNQLRSVVSGGANSKKPNKTPKAKRPELSVGTENKAMSEAAEEDEEEAEQRRFSNGYSQMSHQLLDLSFQLHMKASPLYSSWNTGASPSHLWLSCWRPLLQALARLSSDCRRLVRSQALNLLTRALLIPELQEMDSSCWESCFSEVVFPMLSKLLENFSPMDPIGMEETRFRAIQLVCKTLLNHLTPLAKLDKFDALWLHLIGLLERFLHMERSDMLSDAVPESLKNMILVLDRTDVFAAIPGLRKMTVEKIKSFLPTLADELDKLEQAEKAARTAAIPTVAAEPVSAPMSQEPPQTVEISPDVPAPVPAAPEAVPGPYYAVSQFEVVQEAPIPEPITSPVSLTQQQDVPVEQPQQPAVEPEAVQAHYQLQQEPQQEQDSPDAQQQMTYEQQQQLYAQQYAAYLQQQQQYYQQYPEVYLQHQQAQQQQAQQHQQQQYTAYYSQYGSPQSSAYVHPQASQPQAQPQQQQQNYAINPNFTLVPSPTSAFTPQQSSSTTSVNPIYSEQQQPQHQGYPQQPQSPQ